MMLPRGGNDGILGVAPSAARTRRLLVSLGFLLLGLVWAAAAWGQAGQPNDCSGTVGTDAALVVYPKSGTTGPTAPQQFVTIANPHASAVLWVNATQTGTAAANTAGSFALVPNGSATFARPSYPPPTRISIIASAGSTPYTCLYQ